MSSGFSKSGRLREAVRPYYLRWLYFPLRPEQRPQAFRDCWRFPFEKLTASSRLPESSRPDLLVYPMTDWHTRTQRTQHLVQTFAALGYRCIYINPHLGRQFETAPLFDRDHRLARLAPNIFELHVRLPREPVFHDRLLTAKEEEHIAHAIRQVLPARGHAIQLLSFPLWRGVAQRFRDQDRFPVVYDCHDLLSGFQNISPAIVEAELALFRQADLVLFSSQGLLERYGAGLRRTLLVRNAVNTSAFEAAALASPPQQDPPVAGYVGALESWLDIEAVERAARQYPACRFRLAGRIEFDPIRRLAALPNVELMGEVSYDRVPELMASFRIGLIPFHVNPLTLMTNPIKLYEYFSCGLPVVSTALPEAREMGNLVYLASTPDDFARQVGLALEEHDPARRIRRRDLARRESWAARADEITEEWAGLLTGPQPIVLVPKNR